MTIEIVWTGMGRKAQCPSNPEFPNGVIVAREPDRPHCKAYPKYPAPEVGMWVVKCDDCGMSMMVTAAGRADDPKEIWMPCKPH